jgi:NAD(P)H dehydrogenase (quinone)
VKHKGNGEAYQLNISLILAHPDKRSLNHAIAETAVSRMQKNGHLVNYHDLYAEHFDPILPSPEIPLNAALPPEIEVHCNVYRCCYEYL